MPSPIRPLDDDRPSALRRDKPHGDPAGLIARWREKFDRVLVRLGKPNMELGPFAQHPRRLAVPKHWPAPDRPTRVYLTGPYCSCNNGYFDTTNVQLCTACSYTCQTCVTSATHCLTCPATRTFVSASSSCPCIDKSYDAGVAACASCLYSCATCTNGTTCLTCPATRMLSLALACLCNPGTFDAGQPTCSTCAPTCL